MIRTTPTIPSWIRNFKHDGYTNVFAFLPECSRLYGTETLFGDWDAPTLLLAKDGAPTQAIVDLASREGEDAWRHAQRSRGDAAGWKTNERLVDFASRIPGSKLYGSATANMLYNNPKWSRSLSGFRSGELHDYLVQVLRWVVASMPNVQAIACLGSESWHLTSKAMNAPDAAKQWAGFRDDARALSGIIEGKSIVATPHYHPAARVSAVSMQTGWSALREVIERLPNNSKHQ